MVDWLWSLGALDAVGWSQLLSDRGVVGDFAVVTIGFLVALFEHAAATASDQETKDEEATNDAADNDPCKGACAEATVLLSEGFGYAGCSAGCCRCGGGCCRAASGCSGGR